jgi:hypothetical protein
MDFMDGAQPRVSCYGTADRLSKEAELRTLSSQISGAGRILAPRGGISIPADRA